MAEAKHRLAAILAADVVGYSRLMAADDRGTVAALDASRATFRDAVAAEGGRVVDTAGDSVLAAFETATGAVRAAIAVQTEINRVAETAPEDRRMLFRIGVTLGEVIEKADGTVYGDGVNIAARLEAPSDPGGITISGTAYDHVHNRIDIGYQDLGTLEVKNIPEPVRAYRLATGGTGLTTEIEPTVKLPDKPSIAVLPFDNLGGDTEQEYFTDGLTEDIISALSRFRELHVIARNATFGYKGHSVAIDEVGRELNVGYVLEGSVRKSANRLRVTAQLIDTQNLGHIWTQRYDRELTDVFALQDDLTANIAGALGVALHSAPLTQKTDNMVAYDCVLRARRVSGGQTSAEEHTEARSLVERAVELDPDYAHAHAVLANLYCAEYRWWLNPKPDSLKRSRSHAERAILIDPQDAYGHCMLALVHFFERRQQMFESEAKRAVALNPNDAEIIAFIASLTYFSGDYCAGLKLVDRALELNPMPPGWYRWPLLHQAYAHRYYESTLVECEKVGLQAFWVHLMGAGANGQLDRPAVARESLERLFDTCAHISLEQEIDRWYPSGDRRRHLIEGLARAGLDICDELATAN